MPVRNSAKALVLHEGKILVNRCTSRFGDYYALPGGGQREGETLLEAVRRELLEETGFRVVPLRLSGLYERVCENRADGASHKLYFIFLCHLAEEQGGAPTERDRFQVGMEWIDASELRPAQPLPPRHPRQSPRPARLWGDDLPGLRARTLRRAGPAAAHDRPKRPFPALPAAKRPLAS